MSVVNAGLMLSAPSGYTIDRSLRFRSSASAYLSRTPSSAGNRKTWTWSGWVKRGALGVMGLFEGYSAPTNHTSIIFNSTNTLVVQDYGGASYNLTWESSALFRDVSAWYHVVVNYDTTQASSANAVKIYINGNQISLTFTAVTGAYVQNRDGFVNNTISHTHGRYAAGYYFDGYLTEINFIDGQALDPTYFGETDATTGVWKPISYSGAYGTNGFYLNFSDNSTTTTLGYDASGNGNNWTANNISLTSGVTYDSMTDTPTPYVGGGNYAVLNKLSQISTSTTISNGNLTAVIPASSSTGKGVGTIAVSSGKWYWETTYTTSNGNYLYVGMGNPSSLDPRWLVRGSDGEVFGPTTSGSATAIRFVQGDVIGIALDADNGKWFIRVNGTWQLSADPVAGTGFVHSGLYGDLAPRYENATSGATQTIDCNFGQRPFAYTPPTGFKSLNTYNLPDSTIVDGGEYFDVLTWTGADTSTSRTFTGLQFAPDMFWSKVRSQAYNHIIYDSVRGAGSKLAIAPSGTFTESSFTADQYGYLSSFNSDGVTWTRGSIGSGTNPDGYADYDELNATYVAWAWKANGSGVSNTDGSITSTVSANTTAGFSIVSWVATNGAATIGHGLNSAPQMIIVKDRDSAVNWTVYHESLGNTGGVILNGTAAFAANIAYWNNTSPTSDVFSVGYFSNYLADNHIAYCFSAVDSYSSFGAYLGNGSADGPFVFTGFRPAFVLLKVTNTTANWVIIDNQRNEYNAAGKWLLPDSAAAEYNYDALYPIDFLANGFKLRTSVGTLNLSAGNYIYAAFAENPFKNALAR